MSTDVRPLAPIGQGSLTEQTTRALIDAILQGGFPDHRLPPEPELANSLNISRTTVRAALQSLERLGMVSRTPGRGTVILPHVGRNSIALQRLIGFRDLLQERHDCVEVEQDYRIETRPSPEAVAALGMGPDTPVVRTSKQYIADGQPAIHIDDEIPLAHFLPVDQASIERNDLTGMFDSIFELSRSWPGHEIHHTVVELVSAVSPDDAAFPLALKPGSPYLTLLETHYTVLGEPVAHSSVLVDDRFLRFQVVRHL